MQCLKCQEFYSSTRHDLTAAFWIFAHSMRSNQKNRILLTLQWLCQSSANDEFPLCRFQTIFVFFSFCFSFVARCSMATRDYPTVHSRQSQSTGQQQSMRLMSMRAANSFRISNRKCLICGVVNHFHFTKVREIALQTTASLQIRKLRRA